MEHNNSFVAAMSKAAAPALLMAVCLLMSVAEPAGNLASVATAAAAPVAATLRPPLYGFSQLTWGEAQADVVKTLSAKYTLTNASTKRVLEFDCRHQSIAGEAADLVLVEMSDSGMAGGAITFDPPGPSQLIDQYNRVKALLIQKYGQPSSDAVKFDLPYKAGDGSEIAAIGAGKGHYRGTWLFPVKGHKPNEVSIYIIPAMAVCVSYINGDLQTEYDAEQAKARSNEL